MTVIEQVETETRGDRRKRRTRQALVQATLALISERGIGSFTVQDVTDSADVALATAYNYFGSKEGLISAAMETVMKRLAIKIEETTERFPDPSFAYPYGLTVVLNVMVYDERFRWLHQRPDTLAQSIHRCFGPYATRDIRLGIESGHYHVADVENTWRMISWAVVSISLGILQGELTEDVLKTAIVNQLKMAGLESEAAEDLFMQLPPPIDIE